MSLKCSENHCFDCKSNSKACKQFEEKLREFLSNFDFNRITSSLCQKIERISKRNSKRKYCEYNQKETNRFDGIIQYLTNKFKGNVVDKGVCNLSNNAAIALISDDDKIDIMKIKET